MALPKNDMSLPNDVNNNATNNNKQQNTNLANTRATLFDIDFAL